MIHQLEFSLLTQLRIQRQLGVSGATLDQATAGVVADPAHHGGANTGRANHRVGVFAKGREQFFESVKRAASEHQRLLRVA